MTIRLFTLRASVALAASTLMMLANAVAQTPSTPPAATPIPASSLVLKGHTETVYAIAASANGKLIATGSFDKTVKIWHDDGKLAATLDGKDGHTNMILAVAFSPDGTRLATGSSDNLVKVWDVAAGKLIATLTHPNRVDAVAFDKSGGKLATACVDGNLRIWDVSKVPVPAAKSIVAHVQPGTPVVPQPIYTLAWSPDGKQIATGSFDKSVKIWDTAGGAQLRVLQPAPDRPPLSAEVSAAASGLVGAPAGTLLIRPASAGHTDPVYAVAYSPDGQLLATGSGDRTIKLWKAATGELVMTLQNPNMKQETGGSPPSHPGYIHAVRFSADGKKLFAAGSAPRNTGYMSVWSVADGKLIVGHDFPHGTVHAADLRPDGSVVLACGPKTRQQSDSEAHVVPLGVK